MHDTSLLRRPGLHMERLRHPSTIVLLDVDTVQTSNTLLHHGHYIRSTILVRLIEQRRVQQSTGSNQLQQYLTDGLLRVGCCHCCIYDLMLGAAFVQAPGRLEATTSSNKATPPYASAIASRKSTVASIESAAASLLCGHNEKVLLLRGQQSRLPAQTG
jgi:hypothetical protein